MPRPIRVFVDYEGDLRFAFQLSVTNADASVYLQPAAPHRIYHFGSATFPPGVLSATFNYKGQLEASVAPHISLHESGQVHIRARGGSKAGPIQTPPLADLRGTHVATVGCDHFAGFPVHRGDRENLHPSLDKVAGVESGVESGRFALYINGAAPEFVIDQQRVAFTATVANQQTIPNPIHVAAAYWSQEPMVDESGDPGVIAIAGFQPDASGDDLLYLRGV
jgi:hypothetical protein